MKHLTIVNINDWSALYDGPKSVMQDHRIDVVDLAHHTDGTPFTLRVFNMCGTSVEEEANEWGELPEFLEEAIFEKA